MMEQKSIENFKKLVAIFRPLTTKVQKGKKKYQKLYLEHENFNKKNMKSNKRNCLNIETIRRVEQQTELLLRVERLNLAMSSLTKKNWEVD